MVPQWIIEKKRDGQALSADEIGEFIRLYTDGTIPDYQMAAMAMAMAIYFQGMSPEEVAALTDAMMHSGDVVDTSSIALPKVDKHSTGGIGDKVSIILAPLAARTAGAGADCQGVHLHQGPPHHHRDLFRRTLLRAGAIW